MDPIADTAVLNSPICMRCLMTSVGTRTMEAAIPAPAPATKGPTTFLFSGDQPSACFFSGSYTAKKMAEAGMTPARLPQMPAYSACPPAPASSALMPPPSFIICSRVLIVSMGYSAASTDAPAVAPAARSAATSLHFGGGTSTTTAAASFAVVGRPASSITGWGLDFGLPLPSAGLAAAKLTPAREMVEKPALRRRRGLPLFVSCG
mmetsp:Transcript_20093/g.35815  ORF Transcript_20093/g.35815 Transcript_20093/m.35815 type:complete len:206 (-) Transcript_20093:106-723(-)